MKRTSRGFASYDFEDRNGNPCSFQESSLAEEECVHLGGDIAEVHPMTGETLCRMHINRKMARKLGKMLLKFANEGMEMFKDEPT